MLLKGKKAIVTGGGQSIGKSIALGLAKAGADIVIQYRSRTSEAQAQCTVEEIKKMGRFAIALQADFLESNAPESFISAAIEALKTPDILVNCAAAYEYAPLLDITPEMLANMHKTNVEIPLRLIQALARDLIRRKATGSIINISSFFSFRPAVGNALISCSKAALNTLTKCAALELGPHHIRVNGIAPGRTETPSNQALMEQDPIAWQAIIKHIPLGRAGQADDYAGLAVLLSSDASSWITGTTILCDGGFTIS